MKPWAERAREEAHLLNPPFCCVVISAASSEYNKTSAQAFSFAMAFMILPIILHKKTRDSLPRTVRTSLPVWLETHAEARVGFYERLMALKPYTFEAIRYGLISNWITLEETGNIQCIVSSRKINQAISSLEGDAMVCIKSARFLGKWLTTMASTETIMTLWGIRP